MDLLQGTNHADSFLCIEPSIQVTLTLNGCPTVCIVDTGAQSSLLMRALPGSPLRITKGFFLTADGRAIEMEGQQDVCVHLMGFEVMHSFNIFKKRINTQYCKNLMGIDLLRKLPVMILPGMRSLHLKVDAGEDAQGKWHLLKCPGENALLSPEEESQKAVLNTCTIPELFLPFVDKEERSRVDVINLMQKKLVHLDENTKLFVISSLNRYLAVFGPPSSNKEIPLQIKHEIKIKFNSQPTSKVHTEVPLHLRAMVQKQTVDMWLKGIIKPSTSKWSSPLSIIEIKPSEGIAPSFRICPDFRNLNEITAFNETSMNNIQDVLNILKDSVFFTKIDIFMGYHQIDIKESDREKTAFHVFGKNFEFVKMPLGIKNAAATFQKAMMSLFCCCAGNICLTLNDCLLVYSKNIHDHTVHIAYVLSVIYNSGLRANIMKCDFFQNQFSYLGHTVTAGGVTIDRIDISEFPIPLSCYQINAFLALGESCKHAIPNFSLLKADLESLLTVDYFWSEKHEIAFNEIRACMMANKLFATPNLNNPFKLSVFISDSGWGSILTQMKNGKERNISFAFYEFCHNQTMEPNDTRKLFAVLWSMNQYRSYLLGRNFVLVVNSNKVKQILNDKQFCAPWNGRLIVCISEYDFTIATTLQSDESDG